MAKFASDAILDGLLDVIAASDQMTACSAQPTTYYEAKDPAAWQANTNYALGDCVRPTTRNGKVYEATADSGSSAGSEPTWPTIAGNTVVDGGITWTCRVNYVLASVSMAGGDFTKSAGDTNGRKVTMAQKTGVSIHTTGTVTHVALVDDTAKTLLVTTCTSQVLTAGNTLTFNSWTDTVGAPT